MAHEIGLQSVFKSIESAFKEQDIDTVERLLWPALDQFPHLGQLWFYAGNVFFGKELNALAANCYERALDLEPGNVAMGNLGACYRRLNQHEKAKAMLGKAVEYDPKVPGAWTNLAACYVNEGNPGPGIEAARKALECRPGYARAEWNLGLLLLEAGEFEEGFRLYRSGLGKERLVKNYAGGGDDEPPLLHRGNLAEAAGKTVVMWGEQGIGDELMFASMVRELLDVVDKLVYECHPRLYRIFEDEFLTEVVAGRLVLLPTRKENDPTQANQHGPFAAKLGVGDMGNLFRRSEEDFARIWRAQGPFWRAPNRDEADAYRTSLERLAEGRKIIGLATRGGVVKTMRSYRTLSVSDLAPLFELREEYLFVCFDYEDVGAYVDHVNKTYGDGTLYWWRSIVQHFDYDHTAALVEATDAMVTVCQSVAHLAAGMGHPTHVLVPSKPAWRYGLTGDRWFLYPDNAVRLYRQQGEDWSAAVAALREDLDATLGCDSGAAEPRAAADVR